MAIHPLDPLNGEELSCAADVVRQQAGLDDSAWFETITLEEPLKSHRGLSSINRRAYVCCYEPSSNKTYRGYVDLKTRELTEWYHEPGVQARMVPDEFSYGAAIIRQDARFIEACKKRGITDMSKVLPETWAAGNFGIKEERDKRIAYCYCWLANEAGDNPYARPIANLHPVIDLQHGKVIRIDDFGVVPLPPDPGPLKNSQAQRTDLKDLQITQPDGPSFEVDGFHVRWQKWNLRIGFDQREGLVLHDIGYEDEERLRPIMHRASMAEMVVPYGDPGRGNFRRNAFDTGEYGLGPTLDSLALGCDCLGHIHYFDIWTHDWHGQPHLIENAICMHEEDFGILWKFSDGRSGTSTTTRSRRLVISTLCTIGNYVYGFFWYFYQDGTIGIEVKATGIPFPSGIATDETSAHGAVIAEGVVSHTHQHVFSFRFDMAVDGPKNSAVEVNFEAQPMAPDNPYGNAVRTVETVFANEDGATRELDLGKSRYWKVINKSSRNALDQPVGYKLVPGVNALPFLDPQSPVAKRAGFMFKHFWATAYEHQERFSAGWFPNQHAGGDGLPKWQQQKRAIDDEDIVIWYTMNYHHLPRPEDWPVQPVVYADFHWMPVGFFDRNPAMDVPPAKKKRTTE